MDHRWPWKKKPSYKAGSAAGATGSAATSGAKGDQGKKPKFVQISVESHSHLTSLEKQVKEYEEQVQTLEDRINDLNEKLSEATLEITTKESLVEQHNKVAEEAVSGWEKAEAEALALKNQLESVTLLKITAEDKASHLDDALKECMRQVRNLKEEHEQRLQDVVLTKNKQCERIKLELEARIADLGQEFLKSEAENAALSRSLQERSNMLIKITEEKSQAEAKIELLNSTIESYEREVNSLKYELHVVSKELEIRNEEKNMSMRSAEVANKQRLEGVKKIAKLEAECQRLRGLVRKKLPGPAALAQMKLEVEGLAHDYADTRPKRSTIKPSSPHMSPVTDLSRGNALKFQKDHDFLRERLFEMEEETKMLKEALAKRNSELQASRNLCAKTENKLQGLEMEVIGHHRRSSVVSVSEDGHDDVGSCADSWATGFTSDLSLVNKENNIDKLNNKENVKHLELMDDFLEMERLAGLSDDASVKSDLSTIVANNETIRTDDGVASGEVTCGRHPHPVKQDYMDVTENHVSSTMYQPKGPIESESDTEKLPIMKLRSRISLLLESISNNVDMQKVLEDLRLIEHDAHDVPDHEFHCSEVTCNGSANSDGGVSTVEKEICSSQDSKGSSENMQVIGQELGAGLSYIHEFVLTLGKASRAVVDPCSNVARSCQKIEQFTFTYNKVLYNNGSLADFILELSNVLPEVSESNFKMLGYKGDEVEISSPDCIDKVALQENMLFQKDESKQTYEDGCSRISNPQNPDDGVLVSDYEYRTSEIPLQVLGELKLEKVNLETSLVRCTENLELTQSQLLETEHLLAEAKAQAKAQLAASEKSSSLTETQLRCMAESYRSLETRVQELETEGGIRQAKIETLETELENEKRSNYDTLAKCRELEDQMQRNESCSVCPSMTDNDIKTKQERELAAAAEKLAECQETIFLLGKQLKYLSPQSDVTGSSYSERSQKGDCVPEEQTRSSTKLQEESDHAETDATASTIMQQTGLESAMDVDNSLHSPSNTKSNLLSSSIDLENPKHRATKSTSSSSSRGLSRFFSSKGKTGN